MRHQTWTGPLTAGTAGVAATYTLADLMRGKTITCEDRGKHRYGRMIAFCWANREDLGAAKVSAGMASAFTRYSYVRQERIARIVRLACMAKRRATTVFSMKSGGRRRGMGRCTATDTRSDPLSQKPSAPSRRGWADRKDDRAARAPIYAPDWSRLKPKGSCAAVLCYGLSSARHIDNDGSHNSASSTRLRCAQAEVASSAASRKRASGHGRP